MAVKISLIPTDAKKGTAPFTFDFVEVPESIQVGGSHKLVVHQLVGGSRIIDAMGRDDADITFSGMFLGANATNRSDYLNGLRIRGKTLKLTWAKYSFDCLISEYHATFEQPFKIPYSITFKVLKDNAKASTAFLPSGFDDAINSDGDSLTVLCSKIGSSSLSSSVATLNTAIKSVRTFVGATTATINSVMLPLRQVQTQVTQLITSATGVSNSNANLINKVTALNNLPVLYNIQSIANRIGGNLALTNGASTTNSITVTGGNLYNLAMQYYGDATRWTTIAHANGLTDPNLTGINTLKIPANSVDSGGIYTR